MQIQHKKYVLLFVALFGLQQGMMGMDDSDTITTSPSDEVDSTTVSKNSTEHTGIQQSNNISESNNSISQSNSSISGFNFSHKVSCFGKEGAKFGSESAFIGAFTGFPGVLFNLFGKVIGKGLNHFGYKPVKTVKKKICYKAFEKYIPEKAKKKVNYFLGLVIKTAFFFGLLRVAEKNQTVRDILGKLPQNVGANIAYSVNDVWKLFANKFMIDATINPTIK